MESEDGDPNGGSSTNVKPTLDSKFVNTFYQDLLQPAFREIGEIGKISAKAWKEKIINKLEEIPPENRQQPNPRVAGPTIEALRRIPEAEDISDIYLQLLKTSADNRVAQKAHPAFVSIIRDITGEEAKILNYLATGGERAGRDRDNYDFTFVNKFVEKGKRTGKYDDCIAKQAKCSNPGLAGLYLENLERLELIKIKGDGWDEEDDIKRDHREYHVWSHIITFTEFGKTFHEACIGSKQYENE